MEQLAVRMWVPDRPGVLGSVAATIGTLEGNVLALEVLERDGGVAIDELMIELPRAGMAGELTNALRSIEGVGVEDLRPVPPDTEERGLQVLGSALTILQTANPAAALQALVGHAEELFDPRWCALANLAERSYVQPTMGCVPPIAWLEAFVSGARNTGTEVDTTGSGVIVEPLPSAGLYLCVGRVAPFRRRERREIELLARVGDTAWNSLTPAHDERRAW